MNSRRVCGTSMIELLVVMVVFLIGILAIVQIFPGGFRILGITRNNTTAVVLTQEELERMRARTDEEIEQILPTTYVYNAGLITIQPDWTRSPDEFGFSQPNKGVDQQGNLHDINDNVLGHWAFFSGPNGFRRVIGEGGVISPPINLPSGLGSPKVLQFAPIIPPTNTAPGFQSLLEVHGRDLVKREGNPGALGTVYDYEYFLDAYNTPAATLYIPQDITIAKQYHMSLTAWVATGSTTERRQILDVILTVPANPLGGYFTVPVAPNIPLNPGETLQGVEFDSVRLARSYVPVAVFSADPYEYKIDQTSMGILIFNPAGYKNTELRPGGRLPQLAKVSYDVYDWRIIRDEFRVPDDYPAQQKLKLSNLMFMGRRGIDNLTFTGVPVSVPDEAGGSENRDFLLIDIATGGIYSKTSFEVDYSRGLVRFKDSDNNFANGIQMGLILPGATVPSTVNASGRAVRALYMGFNNWAVQVTKAASSYRDVLALPQSAECYVGGSSQYYNGTALVAGESVTRIYFPVMDLGNKVRISEIWYSNGVAGEPQVMRDQDFLIRPATAADPVGLPYIDITDVDPNATSFNFARYGYAVKDIQGASINVRAVWNPTVFELSSDRPTNLDSIEKFGREWRRNLTQSFIEKGSN